jgi:hypothetical protein
MVCYSFGEGTTMGGSIGSLGTVAACEQDDAQDDTLQYNADTEADNSLPEDYRYITHPCNGGAKSGS